MTIYRLTIILYTGLHPFLFCWAKIVEPNKNVLPIVRNCSCWADFIPFVGRKSFFTPSTYSSSKLFSTCSSSKMFVLELPLFFCWQHLFSFVGPNIFSQQMRKSLPCTNYFELLGVKHCWAQHFWPTKEE